MQTENGEHQDPGADHPPQKSRSPRKRRTSRRATSQGDGTSAGQENVQAQTTGEGMEHVEVNASPDAPQPQAASGHEGNDTTGAALRRWMGNASFRKLVIARLIRKLQ